MHHQLCLHINIYVYLTQHCQGAWEKNGKSVVNYYKNYYSVGRTTATTKTSASTTGVLLQILCTSVLCCCCRIPFHCCQKLISVFYFMLFSIVAINWHLTVGSIVNAGHPSILNGQGFPIVWNIKFFGDYHKYHA